MPANLDMILILAVTLLIMGVVTFTVIADWRLVVYRRRRGCSCINGNPFALRCWPACSCCGDVRRTIRVCPQLICAKWSPQGL